MHIKNNQASFDTHPASRSFSPAAVLLIILVSMVVGCGDSGDPATTVSDFYTPPDPLPSTAPGDLIRAEEVEPIAANSTTFRVLYVSESIAGEPIAVSGLVVVPDSPAPEGGFNTVSWAHGTKGVGDECAPSRGFSGPTHDFFAIAPELVAQNYLAVSSDYEGLGTPGPHPYLVGESQARGALDIVRAASQLDEVGSVGKVAVWGRSQGGQTALFASEIAASWAPELDIAGVIAAGPACCLDQQATLGPSFESSRGLVWMAIVAAANTYGLDLESVFTTEAVEVIDQLLEDEVCYEEWVEAARPFDNAGIVINFAQTPPWPEILEQNSPGGTATELPVLVLQGADDTTTPQFLANILNDQLCEIGTPVDYRVFEGFSHNDSTAMNMPLMLSWTADRFAGLSTESTCE